MPPQEQTSPSDTTTPGVPQQYTPTPEEIERTKKIMHDSLAGRKKKGFLESIKRFFQ